jgi:hypothetical protein
LTHRAAADPSVRFLSGDVGAAVAAARIAAGDRDVVIFGADIARQALEAELIDEFVVHLAPVLLGDGVRLSDAVGAEPVWFERLDGPSTAVTSDPALASPLRSRGAASCHCRATPRLVDQVRTSSSGRPTRAACSRAIITALGVTHRRRGLEDRLRSSTSYRTTSDDWRWAACSAS